MNIEQLRALVEYGNDQARRFRTIGLLHYEWEALSALVEENDRLRRLVRDAYNEAFIEGAQEHTPKGGKPWSESRARRALADLIDTDTLSEAGK